MSLLNKERNLWKAIRKKCVDCSGDSTKEVRLCPIHDCFLYPYRMGKPLEGEELEEYLKIIENKKGGVINL